MTRDEKFMSTALSCAKKAAKLGEVPVGAVIVKDNKIIAKGYNMCEKNHTATQHAEIVAINRACKKLGDWRLDGCEMFVTLEPCPMCAGAILNSRIDRVVFAAKDEVAGACGGVYNLFAMDIGAKTRLSCGTLQNESVNLLKDFFKSVRNKTEVK
jgi:tRNA(adenine34) deaminase